MLSRPCRQYPATRLLLVVVAAVLIAARLLSYIFQHPLQVTPVSLHQIRLFSGLGSQNSMGKRNHQLGTTKAHVFPDTHFSLREHFHSDQGNNKNATITVMDTETGYFYLTPEVLTANISKSGNKWFEIFPEDEYLANNASVFQRAEKVQTKLNDEFLIKGDQICKHNGPYLLVLIPSVVSDVAHRDVIRWTWLKAAESNSWPRTNISVSLRHAFLLGYSQDRQKDYHQLKQESELLGDIVMADFEDTYRNLSRKVLLGLNWARMYCPNSSFVLKADQDTFINVPLMIQILQHVESHVNIEAYILGLRHSYNKPEVVSSGRWGVSRREYPLDFYPRYLYGHTYVLHNRAVSRVLDSAPYVSLIAPEDALVTGILAKVANVTRISAPSFPVCCRDIFDCEVVWNNQVALPEIKLEAQLLQLWANIVSHRCNNTAKFVRLCVTGM